MRFFAESSLWREYILNSATRALLIRLFLHGASESMVAHNNELAIDVR